MEVIVAAWLAVQQMIPRHQDYRLTTIRQLVLLNGVPDQVFGYVRSNTGSDFTPSAIIELKAPNMVLGLLSVIGIDLLPPNSFLRLYDVENRHARRRTDPTADWAKITRQLRKYVIDSAALDIIVMDEGTAIYFTFPLDSTIDSDSVSYAVATSGPFSDPAMAVNPLKLTLRELVAFMCFRSLVRVGIQPRDFTEGSTTAVDAGDAPVFSDSQSQKRPPPPDTSRRVQPKRVRHQPQTNVSNAVTFTGWRVNQLVTLKSTSNLRAHSRDSGFHEIEDRKRRDYHSPFTTAGETAIIYRVQEIFTFAVAVLSPHGSSSLSTNVVAKIPYSDDHLSTELRAYEVLSPLQGDCVPYCYGTGTIDGRSVLLTEYIAPGTTIASLESSCDRSRAVALKTSAIAALQSIHSHGVIHKDACGRNLLVCGVGEDEKVVVADFDIARVYEGDYKTIIELRAWQDRAFVNDAFVRMELCSGI
ncbi:hypothetical protein Q9L58_010477 [Maublancomyces gigas]|uniref:Protein kinase domain-containing protein n=1 Tax=Discina gigas TaxID=1032678 RepID=A0ABR3G4K9_9PEZI